MRLTKRERSAIAKAARKTLLPGTCVSLFGSRVFEEARGGDIDLLVESAVPMTALEGVARRQGFVARLCRMIGESRIDVLVSDLVEGSVSPSLLSPSRQRAVEYLDLPELRPAPLLAAMTGAAGMLAAYRDWAARLLASREPSPRKSACG